MNGKVYLVGAGPGDPELLTMKALRLVQSAEVVLHDDLVSPEILHLIPRTADVQNVGKRCGTKTMRQEEINFLTVTLASSGKQVVRLKSGDPLIFGRAGEEIEALRRADIAYEIVPGVTSALGAAAVTGIPLTHRRVSSTLVLTTGHRAPENVDLERQGFATNETTLVIYMPGQDYAGIADRLTDDRFSQETPIAIISRATTPQQEVHLTTIADLPHSPKLKAPTLLIIGEVVRFADRGVAQQGTFPHELDQAPFDTEAPA